VGEKRTTNRRQFLVNLWKIGGAVLVGAATYTAYEALRPFASGPSGGKLKLGAKADYEVGTATYYPEGRLYVTNAKGNLFALSQKCPHLGCQVPFCESSGRFECPCHGSVFDIAGEWVTGPSPRGMDRYPTAVEGDVVVVDTGTLEAGPDQGVHEYLTPPKGPSCQKGA
jgi:cytochrome b6-f complex iron-sulfur subunit